MNLEAFLANLAGSHLLSEEQLARIRRFDVPGHHPGSPAELAQRLIEQGLLTTWQAQMLLAGRRAFILGRYRLTELLGRGGMGAVFKAEHANLHRVVAIKVMSEKFVNDAAAVARFRQEIQAAAALSHPNIVHAYDADCAQRTHFLVMEYVAGEDLEAIVKRTGALPTGLACEYLRQAAEGLQHAHERGMAHRDIKPANLLVASGVNGSPPVVKILDMGLARLAAEGAEETGLTQTGQVMGTPDYIAPEQAMNTKQADIRSDIYSLGCTLFRLLTGRVPFTGNSVMGKLMARATGEPPHIRSLISDLPRELDEIVLKMMARDPGQRFQTPREVVQALVPFARWDALPLETVAATEIIAGAGASNAKLNQPQSPTVSAESIPVAIEDSELASFFGQLATELADDERAHTDNSQHKSTAAIGAGGKRLQARIERHAQAGRKQLLWSAAGLCLCVVSGLGYWLWDRAGETRLVLEWPESERAESELEIDGRPVRKISKGDLTFSGRPGRRTVRLTREGYQPVEQAWTLARGETQSFRPDWEPTSDKARALRLAELKREVDAVLRGPENGRNPSSLALINKIREYCREGPATSNSLDAAALLGRLSWPVDTLRRDDIPPHELRMAGHGDPAAAPGNLVAVLGDSRLVQGSRISALAFSLDGKLLAGGGGDTLVQLWDPTTGHLVRTLSGSTGDITSLAFLPGGTTLLTGGNDALLWDVSPGDVAEAPPNTLLPGADQVAVSPDGKLWAFTFRLNETDPVIVLVDSERREELRRLGGHTGGISKLAFRNDGRILASSSGDATIRLWDVNTGESLHVLNHATQPVTALAFPRSGNVLATAGNDGSIKLWDSESAQELKTLLGHKSAALCVACGNDASTLISGDATGAVIQWDMETAMPRRTFSGPAGVSAVALAPDERLLAAGDVLGGVRMYRLDSGEEWIPPAGPRAPVESLAVSGDGLWVASVAAGHVRTWDLAPQKDRGLLPVEVNSIHNLMFTPDGQSLMVAARNQPPRFFDFASKTLLRELPFQLENASTVLSPDGQFVAAAQGGIGKMRLQETGSGKLIRELGPTTAYLDYAAYSPDGRFVAAGGLGEHIVALWDVKTGQELRRFDVPNVTGGARFSPDGKRLCVFSSHFTPKLFEVKTGRESLQLADNLYPASTVDFSPDGTRLAASCHHGAIRVWSSANGELQEDFPFVIPGSRGAGPRAVCFTPDGRHLLVGTHYGTIHVLRLPDSR